MRKPVLMVSILSAWAMAIAYYQIELVSGVKVTALMYAAIITMIFGLYAGLHTKDKQKSEEEA